MVCAESDEHADGRASVKIRRALAFGHDVAAAAVAWVVAFWLRFNLEIPDDYLGTVFARLPWVVAIYAFVFGAFGLYRGLWRYASLPDMRRILTAVGIGALAVPAFFAFTRFNVPASRTVYLLTPLLLSVMMIGSRVAYRAWKEGHLQSLFTKPGATPVLVLGAGAAAAMLVRDLAANSAWRVVGLLDDDATKHGAELMGEKVLGPIDKVGEIARFVGVRHTILAMPGASRAARKRTLELCAQHGLSVMTVPAISDIVSGKVSVSELRPVELDDLLGRDPVHLDNAGLREFISGRTVLVTGAGGSIGSELCRQIARFLPARLVLFEASEYALYQIEQELRDSGVAVALSAAIGDAKDARRVRELFQRHRPQIVFHAAAYKHVPLMEGENAFPAVENNILSTIVVARAAREHGTEKFVLVSTDKAVNPANVMGASKRLAEMVCQALQNGNPQFVIVRFGNVLGSTGSVVPRFREQIARGGPVTVTHPEVQRYFMSIPEATQLVLQAAMMGQGGEIYVLDMGEPVRIGDLAKDLIRLSGFSEQDIRVEYTGLRPGEKLYEEPLADAEKTLPTPHPKLRIARARPVHSARLVDELVTWLDAPLVRDAGEVRDALRRWIPEYGPKPTSGAGLVTPISARPAQPGR
jgi:FlaA1/EpsC-like NDP-sugar epimerase